MGFTAAMGHCYAWGAHSMRVCSAHGVQRQRQEEEAPPAHIKDRGMYSRLGGGLHARLQTKAQRALSLCKKSDVGNTQPGPNPAPHSSPDTKQDGGRVLENQLSWRWQQQEEKEDYNGVKWLHHRGSLSGELRGCAGKVVCCAVSAPWAPQPLLRERNTTVHTTVAPQPLREEPTLYYARPRPYTRLHSYSFVRRQSREGVLPALSNVCKSSKIAGQPKFGGSSFRRRPIKGVADLGSALLSSSSGPLAEADGSSIELLAFSGWC